MFIELKGFRPNGVKLPPSVEKIAEGLLELAGVTEIRDTPTGRRIFTVERMPDNVPMAGINWEEADVTARCKCGTCDTEAGYADWSNECLEAQNKLTEDVRVDPREEHDDHPDSLCNCPNCR
jgi:hypothetical protein